MTPTDCTSKILEYSLAPSRGCVLQLRGNPVHGANPRRPVLWPCDRAPPRARKALLPATRYRSSGPLGALLSSPALDVRSMTALQVLQVRACLLKKVHGHPKLAR